jgi:hypothetical protein
MDENLSPQEGMNPESEVIEETVEETTETHVHEDTEETVPKSQFAQVLARAKKAEEEARTLRSQSKPTTNQLSKEDTEMLILKSQGMDDDLLNGMRDLAKIRGKSIMEVQNDPIILAMKDAKDKEAREKAAKLPASRGSSSIKKEKDVTTPNLSDEEHRALWRARNNK